MFPDFDPSKMNPATLMKLSQIIQELPPEKLNRMQQIMHNMRAGFDVKSELEEFERSLPPGFRDRLMSVMLEGGATPPGATVAAQPAQELPAGPMPMDERGARLTLLRAVADGSMTPEEAERLLFPD